MDPVSLTTGGVLLLAGYVLGRTNRRRKGPTAVRPICMCGHHYGTHHPETGACNWNGLQNAYSDKRGTHQVEVQCPCLRYVGPMPVETYWVPPAADMNIVTAPRPLPAPDGDR